MKLFGWCGGSWQHGGEWGEHHPTASQHGAGAGCSTWGDVGTQLCQAAVAEPCLLLHGALVLVVGALPQAELIAFNSTSERGWSLSVDSGCVGPVALCLRSGPEVMAFGPVSGGSRQALLLGSISLSPPCLVVTSWFSIAFLFNLYCNGTLKSK